MRLIGSYNKNIYHYKVVRYADFMRKEIEKECWMLEIEKRFDEMKIEYNSECDENYEANNYVEC